MTPPRLPRNMFFPWANFVHVRSRAYLPPNSIAFQVPVNYTKFDIREYMRQIYNLKVIKVNTYIHIGSRRLVAQGKYAKADSAYKKAILTCEEHFPDEVRMAASTVKQLGDQQTFDFRKMPILHKGLLDKRNRQTARPGESRQRDWMARHAEVWKHPLPLLLSHKSREEYKGLRPTRDSERAMRTDPGLPHAHTSKVRELPQGVPRQGFSRPSWRLIKSSRQHVTPREPKPPRETKPHPDASKGQADVKPAEPVGLVRTQSRREIKAS